MTQDKMRRIITACVVAGTTLLVILLSVLIYGWIRIGVLNRREKRLNAEVEALKEQSQQLEGDAEYYEGLGRFWLAIEKGWVYDQGDK